jgi:hypothetical protein
MSGRLAAPSPATLLRGLLVGGLLAAGLSLAGGEAIGEWIRGTAPEAAAPSVANAASPVTATSAVAFSNAQPRTGSSGRAAEPSPTAADPPPFAPGGDDLLPVSEARAAADVTAPTATTSGRPPQTAAAATPSLGPAAPAPLRLLLWLDRNPLPAGETTGLYLAADAAAGDCQGLGLLQGRRLANGRQLIGPAAPGRHNLGVRCGTLQRELLLVVPWPVLDDPALNRQQIVFDLDAQPGLRALGLAETSPGAEVQTAADFFRDGRQSRFVTAAQAPVHWLAVDDQGRWTDRSAELQPEPAQRQGCARPRQALVADVNGDGRPDVWLACDGEAAVVFVSGDDGRYRRLRGRGDGDGAFDGYGLK